MHDPCPATYGTPICLNRYGSSVLNSPAIDGDAFLTRPTFMNDQLHHKESHYLKVFQEVTRLISSVHAPQQVMDLVVQKLPELMEVDAARTLHCGSSGEDRFRTDR